MDSRADNRGYLPPFVLKNGQTKGKGLEKGNSSSKRKEVLVGKGTK